MKLTPATGLLGFGAKSLTGLTYSAVPNIWPLGSAGLNFTSQTFNDFKGGACVNGFLYRWEKNLLNKSGVTDGEWDNQKDKFKAPYGHAEGCVAVSWDKKTWGDDKWKGAIRYEWLFTMGPEALVTYGLYTTEENTKVRWRTLYINRNTQQSAWKLWEGSDPKSVMPQSPSFLYKGGAYFGFNPDFNKICTQNECAGEPKATKFEAKWSWNEDGHGGKKFSDWATNWSSLGLLSWVQNLNQFEQLTNKEGTWSQR